MYYPPVVKMVPGASLSVASCRCLRFAQSFDRVRVLFGLSVDVCFVGARFSHYRTQILTNAMIINSLLLVALTGLGIAEWLNFYHLLPIDLFVVVGVGAAAALVSLYIEKQPIDLFVVVGVGAAAALVSLYIEKQPGWPRPLPLSDFERVGKSKTGWRRYIERREGW